jgi:hypothetical protein
MYALVMGILCREYGIGRGMGFQALTACNP